MQKWKKIRVKVHQTTWCFHWWLSQAVHWKWLSLSSFLFKQIPEYDFYFSVFNYWIGAILMQDLGYDFSIMALVPFLHLQASEYEGQPLWRGSNALLLTAPFAKRCLLLQDVDLSPIAFHFFFALPCVGEMTSACKSMKCTSRSRAALRKV